MLKKCNKCKQFKNISEFSKGNIYCCKSCCNQRHKEWYYKKMQENPQYFRDWQKKYRSTYIGRLTQIWTNLGTGKKRKKRAISKTDFIEWYTSQEKKCIYYGIYEKNLRNDIFRKNRNSYRLEIDRINNNKMYEKGNLALACKMCNQMKSYIFTFKEMQVIGKMIKKKRESSFSENS